MKSWPFNGWRNFISRVASQPVRRRAKNRLTRDRQPGSRSPGEIQILESRQLLVANVIANYAAMSFNDTQGYVPPDTSGAVGPDSFVETVNQTVTIYRSKTSTNLKVSANLDTFFGVTGGLPHPSGGSFYSDPIVTFDEHINRFIIGDQDVDFSAHVSYFDIAVSKTANPQSLSKADWNFYTVNTTEATYDADYPGNFGYNNGAFVFTLNMFPTVDNNYHVLVASVNAADLAAGVTQNNLRAYTNDFAGFSLRPAVMHDSSQPDDPMWFVKEGGNNSSIDI
ncbi:MAG: hypothetical protein JSS02_03235, partial [Planctomycetes bacterium]|nr:hypothetical protein [Planctomycetota bacterium]